MRYCLFSGVKLAKNLDPDKHVYSDCGIGFDSRSKSSLPGYNVGKKSIFSEFDMSSSVDIDSKKKDMLILGIGPTQGFLSSNKKFYSRLHYNGTNSFLFVNPIKMY